MKTIYYLFLSVMIASMALVSCGSDDEDEPNYPDITLTAGDSYKIPGNNTDWTSDNELIASVTRGVVTAWLVGETTIRNGTKSFKVTVTGKYHFFREPLLKWGASKQDVSDFMLDYSLIGEDESNLVYAGRYSEFMTDYFFGESGLEASIVALMPTRARMDELLAFLNERYIYYPEESSEDEKAYYTLDKKTLVAFMRTTVDSEQVFLVGYVSSSFFNNGTATVRRMVRTMQISLADVN